MDEEEVDLRDYINVLLKRRSIIIIGTLAAIITSAIVSFFFLEPVYQSVVTMMVTKPKYEVKLEPKIRTLLNPEVSLATYQNLIKNREIEEEVLEQLGLNRPPEELTPEALDSMASVEEIKNTNLIQLKMEANAPKKARQIANAWAKLFIEENEKLNLEETRETQNFIEEQLKIAQANLTRGEEELREFNEQNRIAILRMDIYTKIFQLADYKKELFDIKIVLPRERAALEQIQRQLAEQEKLFVLSKSVFDDLLLSRAASEHTEGGISELSGLKVESEELNPLYLGLKTMESYSIISINALETEAKQIAQNIDKINQELAGFKLELAQEELKQTRLQRAMSTAKNTHDVLAQKAEELKITSSEKAGVVRVISWAYEPKSPIKPRKRLNVLIAGFLGLLVSIFVAFFLEYWEKGEEKAEEKTD